MSNNPDKLQLRIKTLQLALSSLEKRIQHEFQGEEKEAWDIASNALQDELLTLKQDVKKAKSQKEPLSENLMEAMETAEKLALKAFLVLSSIIGISNIAAHEIEPVIQQIHQIINPQQPPTKQPPPLPDGAVGGVVLGSGTADQKATLVVGSKMATVTLSKVSSIKLDAYLDKLSHETVAIPLDSVTLRPDKRERALRFVELYKVSNAPDLTGFLRDFENFINS